MGARYELTVVLDNFGYLWSHLVPNMTAQWRRSAGTSL